jgi:hypothetical protein
MDLKASQQHAAQNIKSAKEKFHELDLCCCCRRCLRRWLLLRMLISLLDTTAPKYPSIFAAFVDCNNSRFSLQNGRGAVKVFGVTLRLLTR